MPDNLSTSSYFMWNGVKCFLDVEEYSTHFLPTIKVPMP